MARFRVLIALLLCASAASAQPLQSVIERPLTLPRGTVDLALQGTYSNWANGPAGTVPATLAGESLALGIDFGATDQAQLGLAVSFPINPGAGFGSILASAAVAAGRSVALRVDAGFENFGFNGDNTQGFEHVNRYFGGFGARVRAPITPTVAFVMGRTDAVQFGQFTNVGDSGTGLYVGNTFFTAGASDFLVISGGNHDSGSIVGVNLPLGLLVQPDPHFALTLLSGYSVRISVPSAGSATALHLVPVGLEAVVTPARAFDIGARFYVDGPFALSGATPPPGYFDFRALMFWIGLRTG
ncbi:MAG TPA: hypothetical protein VFE90_24975 [Myxococcales bacterium]|nr:hypothetical protein [Myxococcales bacterium]